MDMGLKIVQDPKSCVGGPIRSPWRGTGGREERRKRPAANIGGELEFGICQQDGPRRKTDLVYFTELIGAGWSAEFALGRVSRRRPSVHGKNRE
jgi:hypothetical protein